MIAPARVVRSDRDRQFRAHRGLRRLFAEGCLLEPILQHEWHLRFPGRVHRRKLLRRETTPRCVTCYAPLPPIKRHKSEGERRRLRLQPPIAVASINKEWIGHS